MSESRRASKGHEVDHDLAIKDAERCAEQGLITSEKLEEYRANHQLYLLTSPGKDKR